MLCVLLLITFSSKKKKETTATKVVIEFNASHITRNTSANVGESYGIFTFRFSTWAIFDTQLANEFLFESMFFLIVQYLRSKFTSQRITKVSFYLENSCGRLNGLRATNSDSLARMTEIERSRNQSSKDYE